MSGNPERTDLTIRNEGFHFRIVVRTFHPKTGLHEPGQPAEVVLGPGAFDCFHVHGGQALEIHLE